MSLHLHWYLPTNGDGRGIVGSGRAGQGGIGDKDAVERAPSIAYLGQIARSGSRSTTPSASITPSCPANRIWRRRTGSARGPAGCCASVAWSNRCRTWPDCRADTPESPQLVVLQSGATDSAAPAARGRRGWCSLLIDGSSLTCPALARASAAGVVVTVTPQARQRVERSFALASDVAARRPVYGRSTGVGANRTVGVDVHDASQSMRLLRSHATSAGRPRDARRIRALLVVRLNQLASGGSGIDPTVLDGLAAMINADALPRVRELGGIGTGDLSALATVALTLCGEVLADGGRASPVAFEPIAFGAGDALPFLSSNAATVADAALAWADLQDLAGVALVVAALSLVAARGSAEAFDRAVGGASPFPGVRVVSRVVSALIRPAPAAARLQDPYAFRALPQVHGVFLDALTRLREVTEAMANVASENPLFVPDVDARVVHHGGFHAAHIGQALDAVNSALVPAARLGLTRLTALSSPAITGATPFLADDTAGSSGIMMVEYVAASALGELLPAAHALGSQSVTLSLGAEEGANFAPAAARVALNSGQAYSVMIAAELVAAVRTIRMGSVPLPDRLADVMTACSALPEPTQDRDLSGDLDVAVAVLPQLRQFFDDLWPANT